MKKKDEFENLMLCRLDKCFKRYDIKHYLFIQPTDLTKAFFFAKTAFLSFQSSKLYFLFFSFSLFFNEVFFRLDGFKDHPISVDKDKLRKSTNSKGLRLSTWVMPMLIGQILHYREAEGWTVSNHTHTNVSKEKVKSLFLIKHFTPEKYDTPLFFLKKWIWWFARKTSDSKCDNLFFYFLPPFCRVCLFMRWDAWYGLKKLCTCHND